jgi:oxygen-independent coproporphyrinogen-3 oxidase
MQGVSMAGLYVHWPYCLSKCPYCDFNSFVSRQQDPTKWRAAYRAALEDAAIRWPTAHIETIFFGGGTPSLMDPSIVHSVIETAQQLWPQSNITEITLEANPGAADLGRFQGYRDAGVTRLSIGVQSFTETGLKVLERFHNVQDAYQAIENAAKVFPRYSFDLIHSRPQQTVAQWQTELTAALPLAGGHLSLYQLTLEPGTRFGQHPPPIPNEDDSIRFLEITQEIMDAAGMPAYEISNFARPSHACRHNMIYWQGVDYIGIGPGAHGRMTEFYPTGDSATLAHRPIATQSIKNPARWLDSVQQLGHGFEHVDILDDLDRKRERVFMGLRLNGGLPRAIFNACNEIVNIEKIAYFQDINLLKRTEDPNHIQLTYNGLLLLNRLTEDLIIWDDTAICRPENVSRETSGDCPDFTLLYDL